jgi:hypothetical protein
MRADVAQIVNLPNRRLAIGLGGELEALDVRRLANPRCSRLPVGATML